MIDHDDGWLVDSGCIERYECSKWLKKKKRPIKKRVPKFMNETEVKK